MKNLPKSHRTHKYSREKNRQELLGKAMQNYVGFEPYLQAAASTFHNDTL